MSKSSVRGITLIELLVAVAVIAIIAAIAYPSFQSGLQRSRRAEAIKGLLSMQLKQEEHRITNPEYVNQASFAAKTSLLGSPSSDYYDFAVSAAGQTSYSLKATAKGTQTGDAACLTMVINKDDSKGSTAGCWK
ncbi:type IV pilin protein [Aeromonas sanarellii]|nr:type IV pilin protein [Aeromonas sanarellii]